MSRNRGVVQAPIESYVVIKNLDLGLLEINPLILKYIYQ